MSIQFIDRRCTVDVQPTSNGYSFEYGGKIHKSRTEKEVHNFFLNEYCLNKLETVKLRLNDKKYYLHFTLDEPEKFSTKRALRSILAQENGSAWIEEKNGKQRYFIEDGWLLSKVREVSKDEFDAHQPSSLMQKVAKFALSILSLAPEAVRTASILLPHCQGMGILGFSVLQPCLVHAQMPAFGEFGVNTNITGSQQFPKIASLEDKGFVIIWDGDQAGNWDIYAQIYNETGRPVSSEFRCNNNMTGVQQYPAVTGQIDRGFVIVWHSDQTMDFDIYAQKYDATGGSVGPEFRCNTNTMGHQYNPAVAELIDGSFVIIWHGDQTGNYDIYGQMYNATAWPIGPEFRCNTNTTGNQVYPAVVGLANGGFVVIWSGDQTGNYDIYGQKYNATAGPVDPEFRCNTNATGIQENPKVARLEGGGFITVWNGYQTGNAHIYGQKYDAIGAFAGPEFCHNTNMTTSQYNPAVAGLKGGGFVTIWHEDQTGHLYIYAQQYDATGTAVGLEFRCNTNTTGSRVYPTVSELKDGGFVTAWQSDQNGVDSDIYGQRYDANGTPVINQSFPATSLIASSFVSSSTISSLTISPGSSAPASSSSAETYSPSQTSAFLDSSSFSQTYPVILSVTEISYGTSNPIIVNGVTVGTFEISGGTGSVNGSSYNTLTIYLNPDVDTQGTLTLFSIPQGQEGEFQTLELVGESCQSFEGSTATDGSGQVVYQVIYQISTCTTTGARPGRSPFSTMLKV